MGARVRRIPVYAGGAFATIGGVSRNRIAALDAATGIATAWNPNANGAVQALVVSGPTVYAGGSFSIIGGTGRDLIAALDVANGAATTWNPMIGAPGAVYAIADGGVQFHVGGAFSSVGGIPQRFSVCLLAPVPLDVLPHGARAGGGVQFRSVSPNPGRGETRIVYALETAGPVRMLVFDPQGRMVARVFDGWQTAGTHTAVWADRSAAPPGPYFIRIEAAARRVTKPFMRIL